ncbi:MAG: carbohydrate ABC transporter permease [Armatimonadetes bacterium]|nr:carbohydrate ABC transporter permease [Armatimonadota bacterium]
MERFWSILRFLFLSIYLIAVAYPMIWVFYTSGKTTQQIYQDPFGLPAVVSSPSAKTAEPLKENFGKAWVESGFSDYILNSVKVVSISLFLVLLLGSMAAYALARFEFKGRAFIATLFLAGLLAPMQLLLIPLFFQFADYGDFMTQALRPLFSSIGFKDFAVSLHDSHAGLIFIYVGASLPFTVFVLTSFFRTIPSEMREASMLDGASEFRTFFRVMMPLARPGLTTAAIFNFLGLWNEYLFGLVFLNSNHLKTLPLGLQGIAMQSQYKNDFGLLFAALTIAMLPTLFVYLVLQERLTKGVTVGALKA